MTLQDIAKAANTSVSTVSRVLAGGANARRISVETRTRVAAAAEQLGYRPNLLARSLRTRRSHTVALLVSDISNPFFGELGVCVERQLHKYGYSMILCNSGEDAALERDYLRLLPQKGIDGLIMVPVLSSADELRRAVRGDMPVVVVDRPIAGLPAVVATDQTKLAERLCDELATGGVKRVLLVAGPRDNVNHLMRADVIRRRFVVIGQHMGPVEVSTGQVAMQQFISAGLLTVDKTDAVVGTNNHLAMAAVQSLSGVAALGKRVPVVGCVDALPLMDCLPVPLVCVKQDLEAMAERAVGLLMQELLGEESVGGVAHVGQLAITVSRNAAFEAGLK